MIRAWLNKQQDKQRLQRVFEKAELCTSYKLGNQATSIFPHINYISHSVDKITYSFLLPTGIDPDKVFKKSYCFKQIFGEFLVLSQINSKTFTLTVFSKDPFPQQLPYDLATIKKQASPHKLPIIAGYDQQGKLLVFDMVKHPHMLLAGETGSGKSTALRAILTTLITCKKPQELRLYLGDMKRSELHFLRNVEHVEGVYTKKEHLLHALQKVRSELERRGDLLDQLELSNIEDYNKGATEPVPYIVVVIDEVALLHKDEEGMNILSDIAAAGRALNIFVVLSMQRPDSQLLDSALKSNLTVRMAFRAADATNSRIILGADGAEGLKQPGRMLLKLESMQQLQCPELDLDKAKDLVAMYKIKQPQNPIENVQEAPQQKEILLGVLEDE